jgi:hypothetical protein
MRSMICWSALGASFPASDDVGFRSPVTLATQDGYARIEDSVGCGREGPGWRKRIRHFSFR